MDKTLPLELGFLSPSHLHRSRGTKHLSLSLTGLARLSLTSAELGDSPLNCLVLIPTLMLDDDSEEPIHDYLEMLDAIQGM